MFKNIILGKELYNEKNNQKRKHRANKNTNVKLVNSFFVFTFQKKKCILESKSEMSFEGMTRKSGDNNTDGHLFNDLHLSVVI